MLKNYIKIAWRNITKNKLFSVINILGLAIGLACSILILLWVQDEQSFDKFHTKHSRIYRVLQHMPFTEKATWVINQGPLAQTLQNDLPEIEQAVKITWIGLQMEYLAAEFNEGGLAADPAFFEMFSFRLLQGDAKTVLASPLSIVLTETLAVKIFGDEDPMGKDILMGGHTNMTVTGITEDPPLNSHLAYDFITTIAFAGQVGYSIDRWNNSGFNTYVLLQEGATLAQGNAKVKNVLDDKPTLEEGATLSLQPLDDIHLSTGLDFDYSRTGNKQYVTIFFASAIFILLIACINFMNMSTAQAMRRAKEVGLRKAIGAEKRQLVLQFLLETTLLAFVAMLGAVALIEAALPIFNSISGKVLDIQYFHFEYFFTFSALMIFTSVLAGAYPAFYISSFSPAKVLKGTSVNRTGNVGFQKFLVVLQFAISAILLIGTLVVYSQVNFMSNKDLGFDQQNLLYFTIGDTKPQLDALRNDLLANPNIAFTAGSSVVTGYNWSNNRWTWEGKHNDLLMRGAYVDYDYFKAFGIEMSSGRSFSPEFLSDSVGVILNETAVRMMELDDPIGKAFTNLDPGSTPYKIIGVTKDYNFRSLHSEIEPLVLFMKPENFYVLWLKISDDNIAETISFVESTWKKYDRDHDFQYGFLDQRLENRYRQEERIGIILQAFSILALIILCLGLYGLLGFSITQRHSEISIRKIFGASTPAILLLLSTGYYRLLLIAIVIAVPVSNYIVRSWLESFAFTTELNLMTFLIPSVCLLLVSSIIITAQSLKATKTNVTELLRSE
jgi:ABC-type antimicrobial peptide transport system permease subunit